MIDLEGCNWQRCLWFRWSLTWFDIFLVKHGNITRDENKSETFTGVCEEARSSFRLKSLFGLCGNRVTVALEEGADLRPRPKTAR